MAYERRLDRNNPGCMVFLVDQSGSMNEPVAGEQRSKADAVAEALNNLLYELVLRCIKDENEGPRHYYDISVIGYGPGVGSALGGALSGRDMVSVVDVADNPVRVEERESVAKAGADGDVGTVPRRHKFPVWVDSVADQRTPMCEALNRTGGMLATWVQQHPDSFPPIVINISDGAATDGDPRVWSRRIQSLATRRQRVAVQPQRVGAQRQPPVLSGKRRGLGKRLRPAAV